MQSLKSGLCNLSNEAYLINLELFLNYFNPARGIVGRVTDCGVRGLELKSPSSILTSWTETSSLSRVVRDGGDPCFVPFSGWKKESPTVESSTWPLSSHKCSENYTKTEAKNYFIVFSRCIRYWRRPSSVSKRHVHGTFSIRSVTRRLPLHAKRNADRLL